MTQIETNIYTADLNKGTITADVWGTEKNQFSGAINLKDMYKGLYTVLYKNGFFDTSNAGRLMKKGMLPDPKRFGRSKDMYEEFFLWSEKADGSIEFEFTWSAQKKSSVNPFGKFKLTINMASRRIVQKEVLTPDNKKVTLQSGTWEFRNKLIYNNSIINDKINNIPIVKNSDMLKTYYIKYFVNDSLVADFNEGEKYKELILGFISGLFK